MTLPISHPECFYCVPEKDFLNQKKDIAQNSINIIADRMIRSFGFKKIKGEEKQSLINRVFHSVAHKYDLMNDIMSVGIHRLWKNALVNHFSLSCNLDQSILDIAGGTGDIAFRLLEASRFQSHVTVLDINTSMLSVGQKRAKKKKMETNINFVEGNAESLPFSDNSFDACTLAFGIRNIPHIDRALSEALRVLKPCGSFLCLEFSEVEIPVLDKFYDLWSFYAIPCIGKAVTGDIESYQYLVESIRRFPGQEDFATMMKAVGFSRVRYYNLTGGIAALHLGWKI